MTDPSDLRDAANDWLKELGVALENVALYSSEHPRGKESLERSYDRLRKLAGGKLAITLARGEGRLTLEGTPLDRDRVFASQLYEELGQRGVHSVEFSEGITFEEFRTFIKCMLLEPERIHERGGLDHVLLDEGVAGVAVNKSGMGKVSEAMDLLTDLSLMDLLAGRAVSLGGESLTSLMEKNPAGLARALSQAAARKDPSPPPGDPGFQAEQIADLLERMASRAAGEQVKPRPGVLVDLGRVLASVPAPAQARIIREMIGSRGHREHLRAAVEEMTPQTLAEVVSAQFGEGRGEFETLHELLMRTAAWTRNRDAALSAVEERLRSGGRSEEESREILDHLMWAELDVSRRFQLLCQGDSLWKVDFQRIKEVLVKLFASDQIEDATTLIQKYLSGLLVEDPELRRAVAENARYILQLVEKTGKGLPMLVRIGTLFMTRVQDETDPDVHTRLAAALGFLADLRLRDGELGAVLELMRKADELAGSESAATREKGQRLCEAFGRVGNDKLFKELADQHLRETGKASLEAAEVMKRAGSRAINYLIDRLADEEDRGTRARLVSLLKEMEQAGSPAFTARLKDPRWFLVRNVVHILGEVGDPSVLGELSEVGKHPDARVRKELVRAYMRIGGDRCEELILGMLADADRSIRVAAVNALPATKGRLAAGVVLDLLRKAPGHANADPEVRLEAAHAAGRMGLEAAVGPLIEVISKKGLLGYAEPAEMRLAAVQALGAIGTDESLEALRSVALADGKREVREAAEGILIAREG